MDRYPHDPDYIPRTTREIACLCVIAACALGLITLVAWSWPW